MVGVVVLPLLVPSDLVLGLFNLVQSDLLGKVVCDFLGPLLLLVRVVLDDCGLGLLSGLDSGSVHLLPLVLELPLAVLDHLFVVLLPLVLGLGGGGRCLLLAELGLLLLKLLLPLLPLLPLDFPLLPELGLLLDLCGLRLLVVILLFLTPVNLRDLLVTGGVLDLLYDGLNVAHGCCANVGKGRAHVGNHLHSLGNLLGVYGRQGVLELLFQPSLLLRAEVQIFLELGFFGLGLGELFAEGSHLPLILSLLALRPLELLLDHPGMPSLEDVAGFDLR
mmetsp:Transcript_16660/g.34383  ORF Transcript_16660/g.34383 Transcript_16660/m.34383 type:complete len:277 (-) Transcript_16660:751-1581(-)